jgi:plastocyanin
MLKRGSTGRRLLLVVAVAALGAMAYAGYALAADSITAADDVYSAPTYTINQGERPNFTNSGLTSHNVTARDNGPDKRVLFSSPTLGGGTSASVDGTQYLSAGTYSFFCTIHPTTMQATLVVTSNGTPQARPSSSIKVTRRSVSQTIKKGLKVKMTPTTTIEGVTLTAKLGKATIGKKATTLNAGFNAPVVKLSKAGKGKLRGKSTAKVSVTADIPFGSPVTSKVKLG